MKKLNPETGMPFKYGEKRDDGRFFIGYILKTINKNGFFREQWSKTQPKQKDSKNRAARRCTNSGRAAVLLNGAKDRSKRKKLICTITKKWIQAKLEVGYCELTKLKFDLNAVQNKRSNPFAPSLDRIDCNLGYTPENTRVVLNIVNMALNEFGLEHLILISKAIVLNN